METFDLRDTLIPFLLLQISNRFKLMQPGEMIEIVGSDACLAQDLQRILAGAAFDLQSVPCCKGRRRRPRLRLIKK